MFRFIVSALVCAVPAGLVLSAGPPASESVETPNQVFDAKSTKALPTQIDVVAHRVFMFDNTAATITVKSTDGKGDLVRSVPSGCGLCKSFAPKRAGSGEVTFEHKDGSKHTIKIQVHPLTLSYRLQLTNVPKRIELLKGQRVSFISKEQVEVEFRATDKGKTALIERDTRWHVRLAPGWVSFAVFETNRVGSGEFKLTWYDDKGKTREDTVSVVVK